MEDFLTQEQTLLADYAVALDQKELELVRQKKAVLAFVGAEHGIQDTEKQIRALHEAEERMASVLEKLLEIKLETEFMDQAEKLCKRCRGLDVHLKDMDKLLSNDLERRRIDLIKEATFLLLPPTAFMTAVDKGIGNGYISIYQAATAGFIVSGSVVFRKKIFQAFRDTAKAVSFLPQQIKDSFLLYYAREMIAERTEAIAGVACVGVEISGARFAAALTEIQKKAERTAASLRRPKKVQAKTEQGKVI